LDGASASQQSGTSRHGRLTFDGPTLTFGAMHGGLSYGIFDMKNVASWSANWFRLTLALVAVATAAASAVTGCSAAPKTSSSGSSGEGGDDVASATSTTTTTAGVGGMIGSGGMGGDDASGGSSAFPCGIDCSTIKTDDCHRAECNMTTKSCEVVNEDDGFSCEDGQFCTVNDACVKGKCVGGPQIECGLTPAACEEVTCDEMAQSCDVAPLAEGSPCNNPLDLCQVGETCQSGVCKGSVNDCFFAPVPNECFEAVCNPQNGMCEPVAGNDGEPCIDASDLCTINRTCAAGKCQGGVAVDCSHLTQNCDIGSCDMNTGKCVAQMVQNGQMCDDLSACTTGETCTNGVCGSGTPITVCEQNGDGCCPNNCNAQNDIDCTVKPSCLAIKTSIPAATSGIYTVDPDLSGPILPSQVYCDMTHDQGGWTLVARFANQDAANWMLDSGEWWYTRTQEVGQTTNRGVNADMISRAFWTVKGSEIRLSRTSNPNDLGLLVTTGNCLNNQTFRNFITGFGDFQNGKVWGNNSVAGTCAAQFGNNFATTNGFQQANCTGDIGAPNSISFWSDWSAGDGAVMMIGGGGNACGRADHGIGVTEANEASFTFSVSSEDDFGSNGSDFACNDPYALNLWVR